jgi:hypothetical protein
MKMERHQWRTRLHPGQQLDIECTDKVEPRLYMVSWTERDGKLRRVLYAKEEKDNAVRYAYRISFEGGNFNDVRLDELIVTEFEVTSTTKIESEYKRQPDGF